MTETHIDLLAETPFGAYMAALGAATLADAARPGVTVSSRDSHEYGTGAVTIHGIAPEEVDDLAREAALSVAADDSAWRQTVSTGQPLLWPRWKIAEMTLGEMRESFYGRAAAVQGLVHLHGRNHPLALLPHAFGVNIGVDAAFTCSGDSDEMVSPRNCEFPLAVEEEWRGITPLMWIPGLRGDTLIQARMMPWAEHIAGMRKAPTWVKTGNAGGGLGRLSPDQAWLALLGLSFFPAKLVRHAFTRAGRFRQIETVITTATHTIPVPQIGSWAWDHGEARLVTTHEPVTISRLRELQFEMVGMDTGDVDAFRDLLRNSPEGMIVKRWRRTMKEFGKATAAEFTLRTHYEDDAIPESVRTGDAIDSDTRVSATPTRGRGRPEIGPRVELRLPQDLLDAAGEQAKRDGMKRADVLRRWIEAGCERE